MEYVTTDQHSVPAMLKPLPYLNPLRKVSRARARAGLGLG